MKLFSMQKALSIISLSDKRQYYMILTKIVPGDKCFPTYCNAFIKKKLTPLTYVILSQKENNRLKMNIIYPRSKPVIPKQ